MTPGRGSNVRLVKRLLPVVAGMFGFGFAMVPLYDVFCDITGLNGKVSGRAAEVAGLEPDLERTVMVEFVANLNQTMPWDFRPEVSTSCRAILSCQNTCPTTTRSRCLR